MTEGNKQGIKTLSFIQCKLIHCNVNVACGAAVSKFKALQTIQRKQESKSSI